MAAIEFTRPAVALPGVKTLWRIVSRLGALKETRATRSALNHLSDRELEDIGLSRGDINRVSITH